MLSTSTSQYLQPEYIQPLPSSLDINNSPLALLAQTCSSIGKEPGSKTAQGGGGSVDSDRKSSSHNTGKESGGGTRAKSESPPTGRHGAGAGGGAEERNRSRTSFNDKKDSGQGQQRSSAAGGKGTTPKPGFRVPPAPSSKECSTSGGERLNGVGESVGDTSGRSCSKDGLHSHIMSSSSVGGRTTGLGGGSAIAASGKPSGGSSCSSMLLELNQEALNKSSLHHGSLHPMYSSSSSSALKDGHHQALHGSLGPSPLGALPFLGYPLSLDPLTAYSASLAAHCSGFAGFGGLSSQKSPVSAAAASGVTGIGSTSCSAATALPPFVSYACVKTVTGGTTLVPVCKDPYCTHCQVALRGAQLAQTACTGPGCGQCAQAPDKGSPTSLASPAPAGLSFFPGGVAAGASAVVASGLSSALCSHAAFSSPPSLQGASHNGATLVTPYVCNWVQGSDYCGKRFTGSDELLQHLRSHTSTAATDALVSPFNAAAAGLSLSAAMGFPLGGFLGCPTLSPGLLSVPSSYPRSLSPNSLLSAVRYHPYKPPSLSVLPGSGPPGLPPAGAFPSLAAFYSPYAFYGQRIGAAAGP